MLYTDAEVQAFDEWLGIGPIAAKNVLDKIAPTIAARALRGATDLPDPTGQWHRACSPLARQVLCDRADEIEAGQP